VTDVGSSVTSLGQEKKLVEHGLKKHAATIHCSNSLSLLQRKISNALLYHAYKELMLKEEHEISVNQLCKLIAYHGHNHAAIKDALKGLLSTVIEWNLVNDTTGVEDWTASAILASVNLRGPLCTYAYSPRMKQLLHTPSMFGNINLYIQAQFKSSYGLALYENCTRYRGLPYTKWFEMDLFRKLMGVPPDKYTIFRDFKKRVLDKSIEEVNTFSDIVVEPELFKQGRQVTKVRFALKERMKKTRIGSNIVSAEDKEESDATDVASSLKSKLIIDYGFSPELAVQIMQEYSCEFIIEKMSVIESSKNYKEGRVENLSSYLLSALKNNYQPPKASIEKSRSPKRSIEETEQEKVKALKKFAETVKKDYTIYRDGIITHFLETMFAEDKDDFMEKFYQYAAPTIDAILKVLRNHTRETIISSPMIKESLNLFALNELPELHAQIDSLDKFIERLPENMRMKWQAYLDSKSVAARA
jgi:plasmid replication initiation protein